jgi:hypothetical protein
MSFRPSLLRITAIALIIVLSGVAAVASSEPAGKDGWIWGCSQESPLTQVDTDWIYSRQ